MSGWTTLVGVADLAVALGRGGVVLLDCRCDLADPAAGRARFAAGHLPGAAFLDLEADLSGPPDGTNGRHPLPDRDGLARRLAAAGLRTSGQAVAYDDAGGAFAARAWWLLRWLGHGPVAVLDGGVQAWVAAGLPLAAGAGPPAAPGDFQPAPLPAMPMVDAAAISASLPGRALRLLDARAAARFAGAPHPLDPVPGHIPGARSRPYADNLAPDGRFRPPDELRRDYLALLDGADPARAAAYCGSGVTAAHDLLAMAHAGLDGAALYPGSWSEWAGDPARPVER